MQTKVSRSGKLIAATYGRNVWTLNISGGRQTDVVTIANATLIEKSSNLFPKGPIL